MSDKSEKKAPQKEQKAPQELNLDDLDVVQGGSLRNVSYTDTVDISEDTENKI